MGMKWDVDGIFRHDALIQILHSWISMSFDMLYFEWTIFTNAKYGFPHSNIQKVEISLTGFLIPVLNRLWMQSSYPPSFLLRWSISTSTCFKYWVNHNQWVKETTNFICESGLTTYRDILLWIKKYYNEKLSYGHEISFYAIISNLIFYYRVPNNISEAFILI